MSARYYRLQCLAEELIRTKVWTVKKYLFYPSFPEIAVEDAL